MRWARASSTLRRVVWEYQRRFFLEVGIALAPYAKSSTQRTVRQNTRVHSRKMLLTFAFACLTDRNAHTLIGWTSHVVYSTAQVRNPGSDAVACDGWDAIKI